MEKKYLQIPNNQSLPDFIMDMDSNMLSSQLFIHKNLFEKLIKSCDVHQEVGKIHKFIWRADDVYCLRSISISTENSGKWKLITDIDIFGVEYNPTSSEEYRIS